MNTEFMTTLRSFKTFMTSNSVPNYVYRYCSSLGKGQWEWFYNQMIIAFEFTDNLEYLFYVLKWILKYDFDDIAYEMYCQDMLDPECRGETLIKPTRWGECDKKYYIRFTYEYNLAI